MVASGHLDELRDGPAVHAGWCYVVSGGVVNTGIWWDPSTWARARAAYVYDLDHHPRAPAGFIHWLHWVIEVHAARGPEGRTALDVPARPELAADVGLTRMHPLRSEVLESMDQAVVEDRAAGRLLSRSAWLHEAVVAAIADAEARSGGPLRPLPAGARLPNRPRKAGTL